MKRPQLHYKDFTPMYVDGKRTHKYVSPSTGEVISKRQFQQAAHGGITLEKKAASNRTKTHSPTPPPTPPPPTETKTKKPLYQPLVTNGKRDKKYRYVDTATGEVISSSTYYRKKKSESEHTGHAKKPITSGSDTSTDTTPDTARPSDRSISEHRKQANNSRENILKTYTDKLNRDARIYGLPLITEKEASKQAEFKFILRALKTKDNSAKGKKAQALVLLGLREPEWTNDVGTSL